MSYAGSGYLYGTQTLPVKPGAGDPTLEPSPDSSGIGPTDFNKLEAFRQSAAAHALAADFQGYADMAGGPPGPAPAGQAYQWAEAGDLFLSRNGRQKRQVFYDVDVTEFGPLVAGSTLSAAANTTTIQAAMTYGYNQIAAHVPVRLVFPPGRFYIADGATSGLGLLWKGNSAQTPELVGAIGRGDGFDQCSTMLQWQGTDNAVMMYGQSANKGRCRDIFFHGNSKAACCVHMGASVFNDWGTLSASAEYEFDHCRFGMVKGAVAGNAAVKVGTDPALTTPPGLTLQSSDARWNNCDFYGEDPGAPGFAWSTLAAEGWKALASGNCKNFVLDHCNFAFCKRAVNWDAGSGFLNVFGTGFADCMIQFQHSGGQLTVIGGDTEAGDVTDCQLLVGTGGGGSFSASISGFEFIGHMGGAVGNPVNWAGYLSLFGVSFLNENSSVSGNPNIPNPYRLNVGGSAGSGFGARIYGCTFECPFGSGMTNFPPLFDGSANWLAPDATSIYSATTDYVLEVGQNAYTTSIGAGPIALQDYSLNPKSYRGLNVLNTGLNNVAAVAPAYIGKLASGWHKFTVGFASFQAAALTKDLNLSQFLPKTSLKRFYMDVTTPFAGPAGALTLSAGYTGAGSTDIMAGKDVKTAAAVFGRDPADLNAAAFGTAANQYSGVQPNLVSAWTLSLRMTSALGNLSGLTAGSVDLYVQTELL